MNVITVAIQEEFGSRAYSAREDHPLYPVLLGATETLERERVTGVVVGADQSVWALAITHKYGTSLSAWSSEDAAKDDLARFCKEYWQDETGESDDDQPSDRDELIRQYFDLVDHEWFELAECKVDPEP